MTMTKLEAWYTLNQLLLDFEVYEHYREYFPDVEETAKFNEMVKVVEEVLTND